MEIVLADGRCVRADAANDPDLHRAVRGGGGVVVTEFEFVLHQVGPIVHVGMLRYDVDRGEELTRLARDVMTALPRQFGAAIADINAPPD